MNVTIEVTADDIARGERHSAYFCPIAWAVRRCLGRPALVFPDKIRFVDVQLNEKIAVRTPGIAAARLNAFDRDGVMEPFDFPLEMTA